MVERKGKSYKFLFRLRCVEAKDNCSKDIQDPLGFFFKELLLPFHDGHLELLVVTVVIVLICIMFGPANLIDPDRDGDIVISSL